MPSSIDRLPSAVSRSKAMRSGPISQTVPTIATAMPTSLRGAGVRDPVTTPMMAVRTGMVATRIVALMAVL